MPIYHSSRKDGLPAKKKSYKGRNRVEVKNISSYKGVEKALTFEITRQRNVIRKGQPIEQATRHFVETQGITTASRSKEEEQDYRDFPEPDLCPLRVSSWVERIDLPDSLMQGVPGSSDSTAVLQTMHVR